MSAKSRSARWLARLDRAAVFLAAALAAFSVYEVLIASHSRTRDLQLANADVVTRCISLRSSILVALNKELLGELQTLTDTYYARQVVIEQCREGGFPASICEKAKYPFLTRYCVEKTEEYTAFFQDLKAEIERQ